MKRLSIENVIEIHNRMIQATGGSPGVRSQELLSSAVECAFLEVFGVPVNNTIYQKAAALCFAIIKNHPFIDGNKRTGVMAALIFLMMNNINVSNGANESIVALGVNTASGKYHKNDIELIFNELN